jgi:ribosomal protein S18 acetylase RimI-like enzyme
MNLRVATKSDLISLSTLASRTFLETYDDLTEEEGSTYIEEFFSESALADHLDSAKSQIFVVEDQQLVGYMLLSINTPPIILSDEPNIECVRLFLDQSVQGKGIGNRLLNTALVWASENGFKVLWLKVWDQNTSAISFYEKNQFSIIGNTSYTEGGMNDRVLIMEHIIDNGCSDGI